MKFLIVVKQKKNVDTFLETVRVLVERGHTVSLAVQERPDARMEERTSEIAGSGLSLLAAPATRSDAWGDVAPLLRSLGDCLHYQQPELRGAGKLQARTIDKLREELRLRVDDAAAAEVLRQIPSGQIAHLRGVLQLAEEQLPTDPIHDAFLREVAPDVLLLSPLVHFGSAQADLVASARRLGIPVGMLLFSWDNLSTKGRLHRPPDWMFVWNARQRREAQQLHGFPPERVVVVGAPRFDSFFALRRQMTAREFLAPFGLDPSAPTLLYVCSSPFVSVAELPFVRTWLEALRRSSGPVRDANVIVRPHPDVPLLDDTHEITTLRWPAARGLQGLVGRPFDDPKAIVLRTSDRAMQGLFECIAHSAAVVGLNTSAELEAAIVGKPVYTVLAGAAADGQHTTLHFHYLLEASGGFVRIAHSLDEHVAQLDAELTSPSPADDIRRFVGEFLRPHGVDHPVSPLLAEALERTFAGSVGARAGVPVHAVRSAMNGRAAGDAAGPEGSDDLEDVDTGLEGDSGDGVTPPSTAGDPMVVTVLDTGLGTDAVRLVRGTGEDGELHRIDKAVRKWLHDQVGVGEMVYDVGAGIGIYAVMAAKYRGAPVIAFEPSYGAFRDLCENLLLNGCDGRVTALPIALAEFEGLGALKYPAGLAGRARHAVRPERWKERRAAGDHRALVQSVCVTTLDVAIERYALPAPRHLRIGDPASALAVLTGAGAVLASATLSSVFVTVHDAEREQVTGCLRAAGLQELRAKPLRRERTHLVWSKAARETVAATAASR
jgi:FkbM family methyltransferase